jgi:hypothetical protein
MMKYQTPYGDEAVVYIKRGTYSNGGTSLSLIDAVDHCPFANCTINMVGLEHDELAIKNYSENEGMLDFLLKEGIVERPHRYESSGYVLVPICKLA